MMSTEAPIEEPELLCPLCEYSLRGLSEPRCPECGHRSTWEELRERQARHPYLFERYPHRNVWSFFRTFVGTLLPGKFWRELSPALPPVRPRIYRFALIVTLIGIGINVLSDVPEVYQIAQSNSAQRQREQFRLTIESTPGPRFKPESAEIVKMLRQAHVTIGEYVSQQFPPLWSISFWYRLWAWDLWGSGELRAVVIILAWPILTFASLMIFRVSLRQAKIKTIHVVRCVVYSGALLPALPVLLLIMNWAMPARMGRFNWTYLGDEGSFWIMVITLFVLGYRLGAGYEYYLRFRQPYLTVFASQVIVFLSLWKISLMMRGM
jgi:hypothetical protein